MTNKEFALKRLASIQELVNNLDVQDCIRYAYNIGRLEELTRQTIDFVERIKENENDEN